MPCGNLRRVAFNKQTIGEALPSSPIFRWTAASEEDAAM
jgi:hypothetical protein